MWTARLAAAGIRARCWRRLSADARLVVFDKDPQAIAAAQELAAQDARVTVVHDGFSSMVDALSALGVQEVDGVMLDLGVSSPQIDEAVTWFFIHAGWPAGYANGYDARRDSGAMVGAGKCR